MGALAFSTDNQIDLLVSGVDYFPSLIGAIDAASQAVHFETYIFDLDSAGLDVRDALCRAAERGVFVTVIVDWLGSGRDVVARLEADFARRGVHFIAFNPWFRRGWARSHRKLCVVDGKTGFVGGININDDMYSDRAPYMLLPAPRWDFAVKIQGSLVHDIRDEMFDQWIRAKAMDLRRQWKQLRQTWEELRHPLARLRKMLRRDEFPDQQGAVAAFVVRDNLRHRRTIEKACLQALGRAKESVYLVNPYFAPGKKLRRGLEAAATRGVKVILLLGVGESRIQDAVSYGYYPRLLSAGVRIFQYRKTQLHGKAVVIDGQWATVGSSNFDGLSLFVNQEANVVVNDRQFAKALQLETEAAIAESPEVFLSDVNNIGKLQRVWYAVAFSIYRSVIRLITRNME